MPDFLSDKFKVEVILDSEESINALEGELVFLNDFADLESVSDGNSVINFWIERPRMTTDDRLEFAGIIPGGFKGGKSSLFTMIFKSKYPLNGGEKIPSFIVVKKIRAFINDGQPSAAKLAFAPIELVMPSEAVEAKLKDYIPPENFTPEIGRDPLMFTGKYFLVFATQDKDSGINYYEVKEGGRSFGRAESPYLLENQLLTERILVRAVDYAGNIREVAVRPLTYGLPYKTFFIVLIALAVLGYFLLKYARKYRKH